MLVVGGYKLGERGSSSQVSARGSVNYRVRHVARVCFDSIHSTGRAPLETVLAVSFYSHKEEARVHVRAIRLTI